MFETNAEMVKFFGRNSTLGIPLVKMGGSLTSLDSMDVKKQHAISASMALTRHFAKLSGDPESLREAIERFSRRHARLIRHPTPEKFFYELSRNVDGFLKQALGQPPEECVSDAFAHYFKALGDSVQKERQRAEDNKVPPESKSKMCCAVS